MMSSRENLFKDENFQSQSLDQFREWIDKDPRIKKCRTDSDFLLKFLRVKKFSLPDAYKLLLNYYRARKTIPEMFENLDPTDPDLDHLISTGCIHILPEVDAHGSPVVFYQSENLNPKRTTIYHSGRVGNLIAEIVNCDPRSQINGITHIYDASVLTLDMIGMVGLNHLRDFSNVWQNSLPFRHRAIYFVNLPPIATAIFNIFKTFLSEKLRSRIKVVNGWDVVHREVGASILPKECGGDIPREEMIESFKKKALELREEILAINDFDIEVNRNEGNFGSALDSELDSIIVGSFRKLEVD